MVYFDPIIEEGLLKRMKWNINSDSDYEVNVFEKKLSNDLLLCISNDEKNELLRKYLKDTISRFNKYGKQEWKEVEFDIKEKIKKGLKILPSNEIEDNKRAKEQLLFDKVLKFCEYSKGLIQEMCSQLYLLDENEVMITKLSSIFKPLSDLCVDCHSVVSKFMVENSEDTSTSIWKDIILDDISTFNYRLNSDLFYRDIQRNLKRNTKKEINQIFLANIISIENATMLTSSNIRFKYWDNVLSLIFTEEESKAILEMYLTSQKKKILIRKLKVVNNSQDPKIIIEKKRKKLDKNYGIKWKGEKDSIHILFKELIKSKIIEPINGDENIFFDFFNTTITVKNSFKWNAELNLIAYLFESLISKKLIGEYTSEYNSIIRESKFFVKELNKEIATLSRLKYEYLESKTLLPRNHKVIDEIILKLPIKNT